ncbi:MAG: nucleotidyltransferase family protein [Fimbriimonadaceae bacterium]|nr:nucleotidyltransferase family protein [Fimbriimonadaceae bacterium]QYK57409.1 MAG: nucleotidyltransferase family protein [Fimbriimonadaceae bacterium]
MDPLAVLESKRAEIAELCRRYGARRLLVFGSSVRGDWNPDTSDFDFLVELEPTRSLFDLGGLQYGLQELLGRHVDVVDWPAAKKAAFRDSAEEQAREIFAA